MTAWVAEAYAKRRKGIEVDPSQVAWEADAPTHPTAERRGIRGGSFWDEADGAQAAYRSRDLPKVEIWDRGFRVVLPGAPSR